jgi:hypothetical protein
MQSFFDVDGVDVRDCHAIQGVMEGVTYNLWGMKEPDYVMRMMATGGPLGVQESCRMARRRWNEGGERLCVHSNIRAHLTGISGIGMRWTITTTYAMHCPQLRTVGSCDGGRLVCSLSSLPSPR